MVKSMINSCLPEFSDFTRVFFSPVKVLCNRHRSLLLQAFKVGHFGNVRPWRQLITLIRVISLRVPIQISLSEE